MLLHTLSIPDEDRALFLLKAWTAFKNKCFYSLRCWTRKTLFVLICTAIYKPLKMTNLHLNKYSSFEVIGAYFLKQGTQLTLRTTSIALLMQEGLTIAKWLPGVGASHNMAARGWSQSQNGNGLLQMQYSLLITTSWLLYSHWLVRKSRAKQQRANYNTLGLSYKLVL